MLSKKLMTAAVLSTSMLMGPVVASAAPPKASTVEQWEAESALEAARGAIERAQRMKALKYDFARARRASATLNQARDAWDQGHYRRAADLAHNARKMASSSAADAADDFQAERADDYVEEQKRLLMHDVLTATDAIPVVTDAGIEFTFGHLFVPETDELSDEGHRIADYIAKVAQTHPDFRLVVEGYVGDSEDPTDALNLSQAQAAAMVDALDVRGVDNARMTSTNNDDPYSTSVDGADFVFVAPEVWVVSP